MVVKWRVAGCCRVGRGRKLTVRAVHDELLIFRGMMLMIWVLWWCYTIDSAVLRSWIEDATKNSCTESLREWLK